MKIKYDLDNNLPLNKILKLHNLTRVLRSIFQEGKKYYSKAFLYKCLYELYNCYNMKELMFQEEPTLINQINQKNASFVIIGILKILVLYLNDVSGINVMIQ